MNVVPVRPFGRLVKPAAALLATLALAAAAELFPGTPMPILRTLTINDPFVWPRVEARQAMLAPAGEGPAPMVTSGGQPTVTTGGQPTAV
jgi:hypothetical protein